MQLVDIRDDVGGYEILEMNSAGMFSCQNSSLDDAESVLMTALARLQQDESNQSSADPAFSDRLRAITLNNLGVVHCHKGQPRKALEHLEAAFAVESRLGVSSPSTTLNLCAAHNSLKHYEKATQYALQTIDALHRVPPQELEDHKVLWGAAWHNLGIAQLNTLGPNLGDSTAVFSIFRNAMDATQELLGPRHPMTIAVHQTYRELRDRLKQNGVFDQHRVAPNGTGRGENKEITVTLVGPDRYRYQQTTSSVPYVKPERPGSQQSPRKMTASQRFSHRLQSTLRGATGVYGAMHPLLKTKTTGPTSPSTSKPGTAEGSPRSARLGQQSSSTPAGALSSRGSPRGGPLASSLPPLPSPPNSSHAHRRSPPQPKRRLSELLLGDMWVDVNASNTTQSLMSTLPTSPNPEQRKNYYAPVRPNYAEAAMHVMAPEDLGNVERVVDPQSNATLDHQHNQITSPIQPQLQQDSRADPTGEQQQQEYTGLSALATAIQRQDGSAPYATQLAAYSGSPNVTGADPLPAL